MLQIYGGNRGGNGGGTPIGPFTQGSVLFADSEGGITEDNTNLFWDDTLNRLGIGTSSPTAVLDLQGDLGTVSPLLKANNFEVRGNGDFYKDESKFLNTIAEGRVVIGYNNNGGGTVNTQIISLGNNNNFDTQFSSDFAVVAGNQNTLNRGGTAGLQVVIGKNNRSRSLNKTILLGYNIAASDIALGSNIGVGGGSSNKQDRFIVIGHSIALSWGPSLENVAASIIGKNISYQGDSSQKAVSLRGYNYQASEQNDEEFVWDFATTSRSASGLHFRAYSRNLLSIGQNTSSFDTSATNLFALKSGILAVTAPNDTIHLQSTDITAGNTTLAIRTEGSSIVKTIADKAATRTITINVNGALYDLLAVPTASP